VFLDHFWPTWERLEGTGEVDSVGFFRFLTVMGLRAFVAENVDVAVVEVGIGGRLDCTNVFPEPVVCAITQLDLDHMALLGDTLALIAAEKAGIIKPGRPVITIEQPEGVLDSVIRPRAERLGAPLALAPPLASVPWPDGRAPVLSLRGSFQLENAALAVALCREFVRQVGAGERPEVLARVRDGLECASWPGRAQTFAVPGTGTVLHLDGAHTPMSIAAAAAWFAGERRPLARAALVFHCTTDRSPRELMAPLRALLPSFSLALFCAPVGRGALEPKEKWGGDATQQWHDGLAATFRELRGGDDGCEVAVCASAEEALARIHHLEGGQQVDVLITGSLQLVGAILSNPLFDDMREKW
jgi:folylpolyglutamate synthase